METVQEERAPTRLIEIEVSVAVFAVAFERPGWLAPEPPAGRICSRGLALYRGASLPGLAAAWSRKRDARQHRN
jgi:hypothetical protein